MNMKKSFLLSAFLASFLFPGIPGVSIAKADSVHRLSLGAGVIHFSNPSEFEFEVGGDYEYRFDPLAGFGILGNYIFSSPGVALIGFPVLYVHPLAGDWFVDAAPIVEFGSGINTEFGFRLGTRMPLPLGILTVVPSFSVDFIGGGQNYIFGLGIQI